MKSHFISTFLAFLLAGCAWGYAGQEGTVRDDPQPTTVEVVEVVGAREDTPARTRLDSSPCGIPVFDIHWFDASTRITHSIDCESRKVLRVQRNPIGDTGYQDARASGLPEKEWYLLVDPRGVRTRYLTNDQLLKLSRQIELEYHGQDTTEDLLIYIVRESFEG